MEYFLPAPPSPNFPHSLSHEGMAATNSEQDRKASEEFFSATPAESEDDASLVHPMSAVVPNPQFRPAWTGATETAEQTETRLKDERSEDQEVR